MLELKQSLRKEEEISCQHLKFFLRDWWAGKVDKPSKEMFKLLKKKQAKDTIPLLVNKKGEEAKDQEENLQLVLTHFKDIFSADIRDHPDKDRYKAKISRAR